MVLKPQPSEERTEHERFWWNSQRRRTEYYYTDGTDKDFEFLDLIDLDDKEYVVLLPVESEDENADGEVIILEVHPLDEENEEYLSIEDATTLNKVFEVFKERFKDDFNFVD